MESTPKTSPTDTTRDEASSGGNTEELVSRRELEESERRYRSLFNSMGDAFSLQEILFDDDGVACDYRFLEVNPAFEKLTGIPASQWIGRRVREVLPDTEDHWIQLCATVARTGTPMRIEQYAQDFDRYFEVLAYSPAPNQCAALATDVTERRRRLRQMETLVAELDHRVKNTLATVLAMSEQTLSRSRTLPEFRDAFTARLHSLTRAHEALASTQWRGVRIDKLCKVVVEPVLGPTDFRSICSPPCLLPASVVTPLSMVLNELATNAVRYGGLPNTGTHWIESGLDGSCETKRFTLRWREEGERTKPADSASTGLGLVLIRGLVEHELDGEIDFQGSESSWEVKLSFPLREHPHAS